MGGLWKDPARWCWKWISNEGKVGIKDPACLGLSRAGVACARTGFGGPGGLPWVYLSVPPGNTGARVCGAGMMGEPWVGLLVVYTKPKDGYSVTG